jgi:hypothetical protein
LPLFRPGSADAISAADSDADQGDECTAQNLAVLLDGTQSDALQTCGRVDGWALKAAHESGLVSSPGHQGLRAYAAPRLGYALANAGHDTWRIQNWLGHQSIQRTTRYTQLSAAPFKDF